jgi:hypothetical protein
MTGMEKMYKFGYYIEGNVIYPFLWMDNGECRMIIGLAIQMKELKRIKLLK